ncbi:class I SAM-dependent methyltransferase [Hoylesella enoeca]|uniref:SAM-dependent methyltransferase n=1 Tax=Hoylesella enoeca TaxID=76123 RepID=A0A0S2KIQ6_9BACT|nr:methyltransferase domain-containing protein [Hoylesella enoeca]ALO48182.1 SAM-dependent methyltransferase [Hoylesella enoeca]
MQYRQSDRKLYFQELSTTSRKYFIPYIEKYKKIICGMNVLEIGCGDGGNLLPFSQKGCNTLGVDLAECRISDAKKFFQEVNATGEFIASDIFDIKGMDGLFDLIICHDVLEHIDNKSFFISSLKRFLAPQGIIFISFPAWQMPFGGHQQICRGRILSHLPWFHLLPKVLYEIFLKLGREKKDTIKELLNIKKTKCPIELFEKLIDKKFSVLDRTLFFINPHYEVKFKLRPRLLHPIIGKIPYIRDFFTTSCFYLLS